MSGKKATPTDWLIEAVTPTWSKEGGYEAPIDAARWAMACVLAEDALDALSFKEMADLFVEGLPSIKTREELEEAVTDWLDYEESDVNDLIQRVAALGWEVGDVATRLTDAGWELQ